MNSLRDEDFFFREIMILDWKIFFPCCAPCVFRMVLGEWFRFQANIEMNSGWCNSVWLPFLAFCRYIEYVKSIEGNPVNSIFGDKDKPVRLIWINLAWCIYNESKLHWELYVHLKRKLGWRLTACVEFGDRKIPVYTWFEISRTLNIYFGHICFSLLCCVTAHLLIQELLNLVVWMTREREGTALHNS